jgi:DNA polymerase-3 subunit alpha (Gram-positive type)
MSGLPIFTIFDLETTGFSPFNGDRIVEIAAIKIQGIELLGEFQTLVNPERTIPYEVIKIHNITDEMVKDAPTIGDILPKFLDFAAGTTLIAHNAQFDMSFINYEIERQGVLNPPLEAICTVNLARKVLPQLSSHSLDSLIEHLNIQCPQRHRALDDVKATAKAFVTMKQKSNSQMLRDCLIRL